MSDEKPKKSRLGTFLQWAGITVALSLLVFSAAGGFLGLQLVTQIKDASVRAPKAKAPGPSKYEIGTSLVNLPPIVTNLAEPPDAWVRLQASIVFDAKAVPAPNLLAAQISADFLGFLKTLTVAQIGGASGLQHLREDLSERASIRSEGRVRELIIQTLVIQ